MEKFIFCAVYAPFRDNSLLWKHVPFYKNFKVECHLAVAYEFSGAVCTLSLYMVKFYCENSYQCLAVNYFCKKHHHKCLRKFKEKAVEKEPVSQIIQRLSLKINRLVFLYHGNSCLICVSISVVTGVINVRFGQIIHIGLVFSLVTLK